MISVKYLEDSYTFYRLSTDNDSIGPSCLPRVYRQIPPHGVNLHAKG